MELTIDTDYFKLLEDKISELIIRMQDMKDEKESFLKTINDQKSQIDSLNNELKDLRESKKKAKERITTIIEKLDKLAV
ncbi:MAG: cell division protein ZapB [Deltaproteobacteria bacterium]|nr:cell division protein ZapB [Deltaproteobacteria bacterium]